MYRILQCLVEPGETLADFDPDLRFSRAWVRGSRFEAPPPVPLELTWVRENEAGCRVALYTQGPLLMTKPLVAALREARVDNFDLYPVTIRSPSGGLACDDYQAVNILGAVAAADMDRSVVLDAPDGPLMTVMFASLVLDLDRTYDLPLFRLAENVSTIVVHERVVRHLERRGGFGLTFVDPADFVG